MRPGSISSSTAAVLMLVIWFAPRGLIGAFAQLRKACVAPGLLPRGGGGPWLSRCFAVDACRALRRAAGRE